MGMTIDNLIDCSECMEFENGKCNSIDINILKRFQLIGKSNAQKCTGFKRKLETNSGIVPNDIALRFMLAGNSNFVMESGRTGKRLVYRLTRKVKRQENGENGEKQIREQSGNSENSGNSEFGNFIYWLNAGGQGGAMQYAGVIYFDHRENKFKFGKGYRGELTAQDIRVKSLLFVLNKFYNEENDINVTIYHVGKCGMCGRKLTDPTSIATGLGPICAKEANIPRRKTGERG